MAARRRPRPRDDPLVGDARRARGDRARHDGHRRPPRVAQRHRGEPLRHRRRLRRGGGAGGGGLRGDRPPRRRGRQAWPRGEPALPAEAGGAWSGSTPPSPAPTTRWPPPPGSPPSSGSGSTSTSPKAPRTAAPWTTRRRSPTTTGCSPMGSHLPDDHPLRGTVVHNPGVEPEQRRRLRRPASPRQPGGAWHRRHRRRHARHLSAGVPAASLGRRHRHTRKAWEWLETGWDVVTEARDDRVTWSYDPIDPWHVAFTPGVRPLRVEIAGEVVARRRGRHQGRSRRGPSESRRAGHPAPRPAVTIDSSPSPSRGRWPSRDAEGAGHGRKGGRSRYPPPHHDLETA